jgi:hypothetical protein
MEVCAARFSVIGLEIELRPLVLFQTFEAALLAKSESCFEMRVLLYFIVRCVFDVR